jgi:SAM-dependent methyltransferase
MRQLHIGPGKDKLPGFETLDIKPGYDHQADASKWLPFADRTFDLIYASHIIEHIPWYETVNTLKEWHRILRPNGVLEIWTVDALKVAKILIDQETLCGNQQLPDGWKRYNPTRNPYLWCAGRTFAYSKDGKADDPNWHKAMFTPFHLMGCLIEAGFAMTMQLEKPRGKDHGYINLGIAGIKA